MLTFAQWQNRHRCARCDGEGGPPPGPSSPGPRVDCEICGGAGDCDGPLDANGHCPHCGYTDDGPDEPNLNAPDAAERLEMADRARRMK